MQMRTRVMLISSAILLLAVGGAGPVNRAEAAAAGALAPLSLIDVGVNSEVQRSHWRPYRHCHRRIVRRCWGWRNRHCRLVVRRYCHRY